jgi:hypothetical protein
MPGILRTSVARRFSSAAPPRYGGALRAVVTYTDPLSASAAAKADAALRAARAASSSGSLQRPPQATNASDGGLPATPSLLVAGASGEASASARAGNGSGAAPGGPSSLLLGIPFGEASLPDWHPIRVARGAVAPRDGPAAEQPRTRASISALLASPSSHPRPDPNPTTLTPTRPPPPRPEGHLLGAGLPHHLGQRAPRQPHHRRGAVLGQLGRDGRDGTQAPLRTGRRLCRLSHSTTISFISTTAAPVSPASCRRPGPSARSAPRARSTWPSLLQVRRLQPDWPAWTFCFPRRLLWTGFPHPHAAPSPDCCLTNATAQCLACPTLSTPRRARMGRRVVWRHDPQPLAAEHRQLREQRGLRRRGCGG